MEQTVAKPARKTAKIYYPKHKRLRNNNQPILIMSSYHFYLIFLGFISFIGYNYAWNIIPRLPYAIESLLGIERCNINWINSNISGLEKALEENVFGQPFLKDALIPQLKDHLKEGRNPTKPLTLSFHGSPGIGKTYVSQIISDHIFVKGRNSKFYRHFTMADVHSFTQGELVNEIKNLVVQCPTSLIVFDEIEKMPDGTFEAIKSFLDYYHRVNNVDFRKSIFIFISNIGMDKINSFSKSLWKKGVKREEFLLSEFEQILREASYVADGGLKETMIVKNFLIDLYLPFLPLERDHVELCIKAIDHEISSDDMRKVMEELLFVPEDTPIFSLTGCKAVENRVRIVRRYRRDEL